MERLAVAAILTLVAVAVALIVQRTRRPASITAPSAHGVALPQTLDRNDFPATPARWLLVVFTSASCSTCASAAAAASQLTSADVGVVDVEWGAARDLHRRYGIDAVPAVAITDRDGSVMRWVLGPTSADALASALAEVRRVAGPGEGRPVDVRGRADRQPNEPADPA